MSTSTAFTLRGPWGIPIQFEASLLLLAVLFGVLFIDAGPLAAAIGFAAIVVAVALHELGHAAACVAQNVPVRRIVLHGGGGYCQHDGRVTPRQSEFIAIAGPLVNLALWAIATLALPLVAAQPEAVIINGSEIFPPTGTTQAERFLTLFARLNLFLALFNLLPILPLDGGRLLHSWLHRFVAPRTANRLTGAVGLVIAVAWIPLMFAAFFTFGFILLFFPNFRLQWRMWRSGVA